jgi:hypothetical protein
MDIAVLRSGQSSDGQIGPFHSPSSWIDALANDKSTNSS